MTRAGIRLFLAACAVLLMGAGVLRVRDTAAQENDWAIDLIASYCPYYHADDYSDCTTPAPNIDITFNPADDTTESVSYSTGEGGGIVVDLPAASVGGANVVTIPDGVAGISAACENPAQEPLDVFVIDNVFSIPAITPGDTIGCSLYLVSLPHEEDAYSLGAVVTQCTQGLEGTVWWVAEFCSAPEGVGISFADASGTTLLDCVADNPNPDPKGAGCSLEIPYGSDPVTVTLDISTIPAGYELVSQNPQIWDIPTEPPTGLLGGPFFLLLPAGTEPGDDELTGMGVAVAYCDADPRVPGNQTYEVCNAVSDVRVIFTNEAGEQIGECLTVPGKIEGGSSAGVCGIEVPYGSTTYATLDFSTTSADYTLISPETQKFVAPETRPDGILSFPYFQFVANDALEGGGTTTPGGPATNVQGRTVVLYSGDCDNLGEEIATLNDVLPEDGDKVGDEKAIPAEMSATTGAAFFLDAAIDEGAALVVYEDDTTDTPVACGDLGGANTHDGMLPIGLGEVEDSGIVGTAVLSYNADNDTTTDVTIVISADLLPEPTGTPTP